MCSLLSLVSRISRIASLMDVASSCSRQMIQKGVCDKQLEVTTKPGAAQPRYAAPKQLIDVSDRRLSHTRNPPPSREPGIYASADFSSKSV